MTGQPAAPPKTTLVDVGHPDNPNVPVTVAVRPQVVDALVDPAGRARAGTARAGTTGVPRLGAVEVKGAARIEGLEAVRTEGLEARQIEGLEAELIAMTGGAGRCWRRRSRDSQSRQSPTM